jgi:gas vesicle protein
MTRGDNSKCMVRKDDSIHDKENQRTGPDREEITAVNDTAAAMMIGEITGHQNSVKITPRSTDTATIEIRAMTDSTRNTSMADDTVMKDITDTVISTKETIQQSLTLGKEKTTPNSYTAESTVHTEVTTHQQTDGIQ